ncbi:hypothetical protein ABS71_15890 [bacterium SCN 62-11]|nr:hypothetical protein [Candidatus Eremiobacteraeota bacterium]ODT62321.1 MAG: hypothetical protein ABS71_15890 [bacterium SCN 62-11]
MKNITVYPSDLSSEEHVPDRDFVVAVIYPEQKHLEVFIDTYEHDLRELFTRPLKAYRGPGQTQQLDPWTREGLEHILFSALLPLGLYGEFE